MLVLGIETSCDETGVAIYDSEVGLLADCLYSQVEIHAKYGGVIPELASRDHIRKTLPLIEEVIEKAGIDTSEIEGVAYTAGPGLVGALLVGAAIGRTGRKYRHAQKHEQWQDSAHRVSLGQSPPILPNAGGARIDMYQPDIRRTRPARGSAARSHPQA